jgi:hypothetical protein
VKRSYSVSGKVDLGVDPKKQKPRILLEYGAFCLKLVPRRGTVVSLLLRLTLDFSQSKDFGCSKERLIRLRADCGVCETLEFVGGGFNRGHLDGLSMP